VLLLMLPRRRRWHCWLRWRALLLLLKLVHGRRRLLR
jgi:hypothetical protein